MQPCVFPGYILISKREGFPPLAAPLPPFGHPLPKRGEESGGEALTWIAAFHSLGGAAIGRLDVPDIPGVGEHGMVTGKRSRSGDVHDRLPHPTALVTVGAGNVPLPREPNQRPSQNVMGQVAYYCTDTCTPVFAELLEELQQDAAIVSHALHVLQQSPNTIVYALPTHPGHHAANDSFGGYCYLNHAAAVAQRLKEGLSLEKVAILDVDYHAGNGTASIFYEDPKFLVVSIHCHPDWEYPFH